MQNDVLRYTKMTNEERKNSGTIAGDSSGSRQRVRSRFPKTNLRYWEESMRKRIDGQYYFADLSYAGRLMEISTRESDKMKAAEKARLMYRFLHAHGWEPFLAKYRPAKYQKVHETSAGDFL